MSWVYSALPTVNISNDRFLCRERDPSASWVYAPEGNLEIVAINKGN